MAQRLGVFLDESSTDGGGPVAVIGGLIVNWNYYAWLDIEWERALQAFGLKAIHMREVGPQGLLADLNNRRSLLSNLARIVNDNKGWSLAATLTTEDFEMHLGWLGKKRWTIYEACFLLTAVMLGKQLEYERYPFNIDYLMDDGNPYKKYVKKAHRFLVDDFQPSYPCHCGMLGFASDTSTRVLQAADVVSWAVRRKHSGAPFNNGFEPLEAIFDRDHIEQRFDPKWMKELSESLKKRAETKAPSQ